nr:transketolase-like protein 2 [Onthophagus taurus]
MSTNGDKLSPVEIQELNNISNKLRVSALRSTNAARSGHPSSCSSVAEILAVLFYKVMKFRLSHPKDPASDRLILSKGHAAPILYAAWAEVGLFPKEKLLDLRQIYSDLEGHPTPRLNFIDFATGSLGQGLSVAVGMAYVGKIIENMKYRIFCIIGDSESSEGAIWEACNFASFYKLNNLCVIIDVNRLGQTGQTPLGHDTNAYQKRFQAFGFNSIIVDGHNVEELINAFEKAESQQLKPTCIIAKTFKGKHFLNLENVSNFHGKLLGERFDKIVEHIESLITNKGKTFLEIHEPDWIYPIPENKGAIQLSIPPCYINTDFISTREAFGNALIKLAQTSERIISFDADVRNSTYSEKLKEYDESRHIDCFMAEQNLVSAAIGACCRTNLIPFISSFSSFLTRAFDQLRMGAVSSTNIKICGTHAGVSTGEDGPSQMAMEDIAMFRTLPGCTIFYPSDAVATERAVEFAANIQGMCYVRLTRPKNEVIYSNDRHFAVGEAQVLLKHSDDQVLLISAGITLVEAFNAAKELEKDGIHIRIIDLFTIKPIDANCIKKNAKEALGKIITVEEHYPEGGIGEAVLSAVADEPNILLKKIAIPKMARSGRPRELLDYFGVSTCNIVLMIKEFLNIKTDLGESEENEASKITQTTEAGDTNTNTIENLK